jgi:hypothetical protein
VPFILQQLLLLIYTVYSHGWNVYGRTNLVLYGYTRLFATTAVRGCPVHLNTLAERLSMLVVPETQDSHIFVPWWDSTAIQSETVHVKARLQPQRIVQKKSLSILCSEAAIFKQPSTVRPHSCQVETINMAHASAHLTAEVKGDANENQPPVT